MNKTQLEALKTIVTIPLPPKSETERLGIDWLEVSVRTSNALRNAGIVDISQVYKMGITLLKLPNIGRHAMTELREEIRRFYGSSLLWPDRDAGVTDGCGRKDPNSTVTIS